jgi:beta-galactosidase
MKRILFRSLVSVGLAVFALGAHAMGPKPAASVRVTQSFDADWRFLKSDAPGAEQSAFADDTWRSLSVPHDWSIEGPFDEKAATRGSGGFLPSGVAWYRKHFSLPANASAKRVFIEFDGVMQNSDVWINGHKLGHRPFGYVSFRYELTGHINFGDKSTNVLAVRTDTSAQPASRWYSGAGIYRHVRLIVTDPVHLEQWATFVSTATKSDEPGDFVHVRTSVLNQGATSRNAALRITLIDPDGKPVATRDVAARSIAAGASAAFEEEIKLTRAKHWDLATPHLYRAVVSVHDGKGATLDDESVTFGIRNVWFVSETGFWLNGKNFKLLGVCLHHDGGAFGAAVPLSIWEYRLNALRELGVNAIRTAHNPPDPGFLDLCDRMGFLVMDELFDCWEVAKNPHDYHLHFNEWSKIDVRDTVRRDRNHPSVVLYSVGNEIHDTPKEARAKEILAGLVPVFHENDPTRPVTQALFRPNVSHDYTNGLADLLDVIGTNYRDTELIAAWKAKPGRKIIGTEQQHNRQTWLTLRDSAPEAGQFLWSGIDYLGEAGRWPTIAAGSGLLDKTGAVKPIGLERQSWWSPKPVVSIVRRTAPSQFAQGDPGFVPLNRQQVQFPDWSPTNREPHEENVEVYSNCDSVELLLNDQSLGAKPLNADASPRTWKVPFAPGVLRAVAKSKDTVVATTELRTAGAPTRIVLSASRTKLAPGFEEVAVITALVVDANGIVVPNAAPLVSFSATGPGAVVATDSGDNAGHESFQAAERPAFRGRCVAFVRATAATGNIQLTASAPGLAPGRISFAAAASR